MSKKTYVTFRKLHQTYQQRIIALEHIIVSRLHPNVAHQYLQTLESLCTHFRASDFPLEQLQMDLAHASYTPYRTLFRSWKKQVSSMETQLRTFLCGSREHD